MLMAMAERIIKYNFYRGDDELRESLDYGYSYDRELFLDQDLRFMREAAKRLESGVEVRYFVSS